MHLAFLRLQTSSRDWYKDFYRSDMYCFGIGLDSYLGAIGERLRRHTYKPEPAYKVYVPKKDGFLRPITMINFADMVVYQSIINVIADAFYEQLRPFYNTIVFGNHYNGESDEESKKFFYAPWKEQWRKFRTKIESNWDNGYKYVSTFDLSLFYETIDHKILGDMLNECGIENEAIDVLKMQLVAWVLDENRKICINNKLNYLHGIPQGPIGSAFLAEVYLHYIDVAMRGYMLQEKDVIYLRYADDVRILAKRKIAAQKALLNLSMLCRDLGLVPNAKKIEISYIKEKRELHEQGKMISKIANQIRKEGTISRKQNKKLTKRIIQALENDDICDTEKGNLIEKPVDKSLYRFALYRIEPDETLCELLIKNYKKLPHVFDEVCHYLSRAWGNNLTILKWVEEKIKEEKPLYYHSQAMLLKHFKGQISLSEHCIELINDQKVDWFIKYYTLDWISGNKDLLTSINVQDGNPFLDKRIWFLKYISASDFTSKKGILRQMLRNDDNSIALMGVALVLEDETFFSLLHEDKNLSSFLKAALYNLPSNAIAEGIKENAHIEKAELFFSEEIWSKDELDTLNTFYFGVQVGGDSHPPSWVVNIDAINHMIVVKLFKINGNEIAGVNITEYGELLDYKNYLKDNYPETYYVFKEIHDVRCEKGAHPLRRDGSIAKLLNKNEKDSLRKKEIKALKEIIAIHC